MAGLVRMLQYMPANYPGRSRFERLLGEMAERVVAVQPSDGVWCTNLLDTAQVGEKEISGSGFLVYALAWGVNQGLLSRTEFMPALMKAWSALSEKMDIQGRVSTGESVGGETRGSGSHSSKDHGTGAFLLAGSEMYRMAVMRDAACVRVTVTNPADFWRDCETVELNLGQVASRLHVLRDSGRFAVMDCRSSRIMDSQVYSSIPGKPPDRLLFQVELGPHESGSYFVLDASALPAVPPPIVKTFARYVPERYDDFAWESDRIAFRAYGQALMTAPGEPLTSSGIDVWIKRTRQLIVNELYASGNFHNDSGAAMDDYRVGTSRGDGGLGIWDGKRLFVSKTTIAGSL